MPEASAQLTKPIAEKPFEIDANLNQIRGSVGANADQAIGNKGIPHNPVPAEESFPIPDYVPGGATVTPSNNQIVDLPESHKPNKTLDNLRHLVDVNFGDEDGAPVRIGPASDVKEHQSRRDILMKNIKNNPHPKRGLLEAFKDYFYDYKKKPKAA